ncbi:MAG: cyclic nucleotide-binding domain-containing protein [Pseudomonadota bacterium]
MTLDQDIELLARQPVFVDFSLEQLRLIAFGSQKHRYNKGSELFRDGQSADCGYLIIHGEIQVFLTKNNSSSLAGIFARGDLLGELAMLTANRRAGTAVVTADCEVLRITRAIVRRILEEYPELAALLHDRISSSVSSFSNRLEPVRKRFEAIDASDKNNAS